MEEKPAAPWENFLSQFFWVGREGVSLARTSNMDDAVSQTPSEMVYLSLGNCGPSPEGSATLFALPVFYLTFLSHPAAMTDF